MDSNNSEHFNLGGASEESSKKKKLIIIITVSAVLLALIIVLVVLLITAKDDGDDEEEKMKKFCYNIPKAELHIHIEGTFEPELAFQIAKRNNITLNYSSAEELREKYKFNNLQEFLDLYYELCDVLRKKEDFSDLAYAYASKSYDQGVKYAEIFFDPQSHLPRNITFETLITGLRDGLDKLKKEHSDFDYNLIMCFLRHLSQDDAIETYNIAKNYSQLFFGVGLDSSEKDHPPSNFSEVFEIARNDSFHVVAHAGEEGPPAYIEEAVEILKVERIDHGVTIMNNETLVQKVANKKIPLTLCPLSNQKLQVCPDLRNYKIREMIQKGLLVMINSDDPSYFGGYVGDNFYAMVQYLNFNKTELGELAINSFKSTFLPEEKKKKYIQEVQTFLENN